MHVINNILFLCVICMPMHLYVYVLSVLFLIILSRKTVTQLKKKGIL